MVIMLQILLFSLRVSVGIAAAITYHQHAVAMSRVQSKLKFEFGYPNSSFNA